MPSVLFTNGNKTFEALVVTASLQVGVIYTNTSNEEDLNPNTLLTVEMSNNCSVAVSRT